MQEKLDLFAAFERSAQQHSCDLEQRPAAPTVIHMFWDKSEALLSSKGSTLQLQAPDLLGLWSCLRVGMTVHLWAYSALELFTHPKLHVKDSSALLSKQEAKALLRRGLRIHHLSDLVRLLAADLHDQELSSGSWIGDLDQIWLRPFGPCPSGSGHVFATMHARGGAPRGSLGSARYWKYNFVRAPDEQIHFSNSPMAFPSRSEVLASAIMAIRGLLSKQRDLSKLDYTALVKMMLQQIHKHGLALDVVDPIVFHPMPHFVGKQRLFTSAAVSTEEETAFCHQVSLPSCELVHQQAFVLSQTWFSWSFNLSSVAEQPFEEGSFYASILNGIGLSSLVWKSFNVVSCDFLQGFCEASTMAVPEVSSEVSTFSLPEVSTEVSTMPVPEVSTVPWPVKRRRLPLWKFDLCALGIVFGMLPSGPPSAFLRWQDYLPVAATCFMALELGKQELRVKFGYTMERMLRLRAASLRPMVSTPSALSIWGGALDLWRSWSAEPDFDPTAVALVQAMTVDCLLACAPATYQHGGLRETLQGAHSCRDFDRMCHSMFACKHVFGEPFFA